MPTTIATLKRFVRPQANVQASVAGLTGVLRWYSNYFNSGKDALVRKKESKLVERPRIGASSFRLVSGLRVGSITDASQILNRNNCTLRQG